MLKKLVIYLSYHRLEKMFTFSQAIPWKGKQSLLLEDIFCAFVTQSEKSLSKKEVISRKIVRKDTNYVLHFIVIS
jgi:hypothetical protein